MVIGKSFRHKRCGEKLWRSPVVGLNVWSMAITGKIQIVSWTPARFHATNLHDTVLA